MAIPSAYTPYLTIQGSYNNFMGSPSGGTGSNMPSPSNNFPLNYNQPYSHLRYPSPNVNISANSDPNYRINSLANRIYSNELGTNLGQARAFNTAEKRAIGLESPLTGDAQQTALRDIQAGVPSNIAYGNAYSGGSLGKAKPGSLEWNNMRTQQNLFNSINQGNLGFQGFDTNYIQNAYKKLISG